MEVSEVIKNQNFRLELLIKLYVESGGLETFCFRSVVTIQSLFPGIEKDRIISALLFFYEEGYLTYFDSSTLGGRDMMQIRLKSKGIRLAETILLKGNIDQFMSDFSLLTFNYYYYIHDVDKSKVIIGQNNQQ